MGISVNDSKLAELARLIEGWPGLVSAPAEELIEDCLVLVQACARLGLQGVKVAGRRAEEAGHDAALREAFDAAVARALAPMPVLVGPCLPFVRVGGRVPAPNT